MLRWSVVEGCCFRKLGVTATTQTQLFLRHGVHILDLLRSDAVWKDKQRGVVATTQTRHPEVQ